MDFNLRHGGLKFLKHRLGASDHCVRYACELGNLNAVAVIGAATHNAAEKGDIISAFFNRNIVVFHSINQVFQRCQLMIMRCKQSSRTDTPLIRNVLHDSTRNAHAVIGRGAAADFVEDNQTGFCCLIQDIRDLAHLHHKGGLTACQIVRCTDTGEHPIHNADMRR